MSEAQFSVLSKGLNFATSHSKNDKINLIANVENAINKLSASNDEKTCLRSQVIGAVNAAQPSKNLSPDDRNALKSLKNDNDICIVPADKGRVTVVMKKTDYE